MTLKGQLTQNCKDMLLTWELASFGDIGNQSPLEYNGTEWHSFCCD